MENAKDSNLPTNEIEIDRRIREANKEWERSAHEKKTSDTGFECWSILSNGEYGASFPTTGRIPAGFYEIQYRHSIGANVMVQKSVNSDELYQLPSKEITDIIEDIQKFWNNAVKYREYTFIHKRGILLYGPPGCGKSGIIQLCTRHLIENLDGIIINIPDIDAIHRYNEFIDSFRKIEPNRPLIVILEDLDSIAGENRHETSLVLNILDGVKQIENVVYIATTNYPERLEERITNRPSRFDRRYEIGMPEVEVRRAYIESKVTKEDLKTIDMDSWLKYTEDMSLAHLRELIVSVMAMRNSFEETIERLSGLKIKPKIGSKSNIGFR